MTKNEAGIPLTGSAATNVSTGLLVAAVVGLSMWIAVETGLAVRRR